MSVVCTCPKHTVQVSFANMACICYCSRHSVYMLLLQAKMPHCILLPIALTNFTQIFHLSLWIPSMLHFFVPATSVGTRSQNFRGMPPPPLPPSQNILGRIFGSKGILISSTTNIQPFPNPFSQQVWDILSFSFKTYKIVEKNVEMARSHCLMQTLSPTTFTLPPYLFIANNIIENSVCTVQLVRLLLNIIPGFLS